MENIFENISTYGYIALFLYSLGGGFVALIAAGVLSYMGLMDLTTSLIVAFVANVIGDQILFLLGRHNKPQIMPYLRKHRRKLALSHILMKKHGNKILVFQKFVYGIKTLIPIAVGITKYDQRSFLIYNMIGAFLWAIVFGVGSFLAGDLFKKLVSVISDQPILMPIFLFTIIGIIYAFLHFATRKKKR